MNALLSADSLLSLLVPMICSKWVLFIHKKMTREEREALEQDICNLYYDCLEIHKNYGNLF